MSGLTILIIIFSIPIGAGIFIHYYLNPHYSKKSFGGTNFTLSKTRYYGNNRKGRRLANNNNQNQRTRSRYYWDKVK